MTTTLADRAGIVALGAATAALGASFLAWGTSGHRSRTSYELSRVAVRFELLPSALEPFAHVWLLLPVLVGVAWLARATGRDRVAASVCVVVGVLSAVAAALTMQSPLVTEAGATIALGTGVLAIGAGIVRLLFARTHAHER